MVSHEKQPKIRKKYLNFATKPAIVNKTFPLLSFKVTVPALQRAALYLNVIGCALLPVTLSLLGSCSAHPLERPELPGDEPEAPTEAPVPDVPEIDFPEPVGDAVAATFVHDCQRMAVSVSVAEVDGIRMLRVTGDGFERYISVAADGEISLVTSEAGAGFEGSIVEDLATAAKRLRSAGRYTDYIYNVGNAVADGGHRLYLATAYTAAPTENGSAESGSAPSGLTVPAIDCIEFEGGEWEFVATATLTDAWLLPAVTLNAQRFEPADYPWPVEVHRRGRQLRISGLYRGSRCPLAMSNGAPADAALYIIMYSSNETSGEDFPLESVCKVEIPAQPAPFVNGDLWPDMIFESVLF